MRLRALSLSTLAVSMLLVACDGGGSADLLSDLPVAGSPDAPSVVTKGKLPGGTVDTSSSEEPGTSVASIVGTWTATRPATDSTPQEVMTALFKEDGTGKITVVTPGERDAKLTASWSKAGSMYRLVFTDTEGEEYEGTGSVLGNKLSVNFPLLGMALELDRVK